MLCEIHILEKDSVDLMSEDIALKRKVGAMYHSEVSLEPQQDLYHPVGWAG